MTRDWTWFGWDDSELLNLATGSHIFMTATDTEPWDGLYEITHRHGSSHTTERTLYRGRVEEMKERMRWLARRLGVEAKSDPDTGDTHA